MQRTITAAVLFLLAGRAMGEGQETRGAIEAVTVYRGEALVTRLVDLPKDAPATGLVEVVVTDLPERIQPASLHAESAEGLSIRSISYRTRPVSQDVREDVRKIDARIEDLNQKLAVSRRRTELAAEGKAYLTSLQAFVAPAATVEMTRGVLNADTIEKLTKFMLGERGRIATEELELAAEQKRFSAELELAGRERQQLTAGSSRTLREAVVFVNREGKAPGKIRLRYLVDGATWTPSYNVRSNGLKQSSENAAAPRNVTLEYNAAIQQMSGEDWSGVNMTLSTATPSLVAKSPSLSAMTVALGAPNPALAVLGGDAYYKTRDDLKKRQSEIVEKRSNRNINTPAGSVGGGDAGQVQQDREADKFINDVADQIQLLDLRAGGKVARTREVKGPEEGVSVTYTMPGAITLPSRNDRQLIQISSVSMPAAFTKVATPVLTQFVYDEARVTNTGTSVLLAGPVTAYADGAFVGSGDIPTVASGEAFSVGFGIDSSLRAAHELVERTENVQGGNRVVELTYRLTVENFGAAPVPVRILDRMPRSTSGDLRVTLLSTTPELSADKDYEKSLRKENILRWDLTAPAQSKDGPLTVEYKFKLEYDKQMTITGMGG